MRVILFKSRSGRSKLNQTLDTFNVFTLVMDLQYLSIGIVTLISKRESKNSKGDEKF